MDKVRQSFALNLIDQCLCIISDGIGGRPWQDAAVGLISNLLDEYEFFGPDSTQVDWNARVYALNSANLGDREQAIEQLFDFFAVASKNVFA